ncbi:MAG: ATP-binding cassette domain-containing protein [Erysipelotrichaceae bacterium]|nr:ATP-binding cassette domain-containing protein [Erysipelotrichaceae bacterium]MDY5252245.1 ATP-binding cassette domain-containing protein [Erysipelotrichaceae bacterium]
MIELIDIVKTFNTKKAQIKAVRGVNLKINKGEIFGIIGYSGAGKSTLIRIINQLELQTSGQVIIDGQDLTKLSHGELLKSRQKIGMIFQHFNLLWSRTVAENIEFPLEIAHVDKATRQEKVKKLIQMVGLEGRENAYPSELSGGQKQRVGIARALANDPKILLCDEATSALDPETTDAILQLLVKINKELNITIVMITHQMEVVQKICHRLAVMEDGKIVEEGEVKAIFAHPQNATTRRFIQTINGTDVEKTRQELKKLYPYGQLIRVSFTTNSDEPIIASAIKQCALNVSIVNANINHTSSGPLGVTYLHVTNGDDAQYDKFVKALEAKEAKVEIL